MRARSRQSRPMRVLHSVIDKDRRCNQTISPIDNSGTGPGVVGIVFSVIIGIIGDIFSRRADFAVAAFMMTMNRAILVNFLPSINEGTCGIYIPAKNIESVTFEKYLAPFTLSLWIAIAFSGVTFAISKFLLLKVHVCEAVFGFDDIWISFSCFLGRAPTPTSIDKKSSYKTMIIATLLCGSVIWMAYNGELTSELAILKKKYPFDDMESFSKTNWR